MENSDEVIVPEANDKLNANAEPSGKLKKPARPKKEIDKKKLFTILGSVVATLAVVALVYFLTRPVEAPAPSSDDTSEGQAPDLEVTTTYSTPEDSTDPEGDYIKHLEETKASAKTSEEALRAILDQVSFKISLSSFDEAKTLLDSINLDDYPSHSERFQYYNVYSRLYAETALNDSALYAEYVAKATEERNLLLTGAE